LDASCGCSSSESLAARLLSTLRAAGKRPKVAMIAAMHNLLAAIYSVAIHRRSFVPHLV
jgi:hypothetical protein